MKVTLNGQAREFEEESLALPAMIELVGLGQQPVLVELNGAALLAREFSETVIHDGDRIELIRMVAGG
ncbi:MAG: sulfur carrier protein ThiS [Verrucomicrobiales bacterium]